MFPLIETVCKQMTAYLEKKIESDCKYFDAKDLAARYTIDTVCNCVYSIDSRVFAAETELCPIYEMARELFKPTTKLFTYSNALGIFPIIKKIYRMQYLSNNVKTFFSTFTSDIINDRKESLDTKQNDFLNYLFELSRKKDISDVDIAAHTIAFLFDGFETSSAVLAHAFYLLAVHNDSQAVLRNEINDVISTHGKITFDEIKEMEYLDQVVNGLCIKYYYIDIQKKNKKFNKISLFVFNIHAETLRLFPPLGIIGKLCTSSTYFTDYKDKKILIDKGVVIWLPIYSIHRDSEYYDNPDEFRPNRFCGKNGGVKEFKDKHVFLAFGAGPRQCLGRNEYINRYR